jgi:tetratricopeptide (TPR) repeat protein
MTRRANELFFLAALLWCMQGHAAALQPLPREMHDAALASISCAYREEFKKAEEHARRIIRRYPEHPAGYFFYAAVLDMRMRNAESDENELEFYRNCDFAIAKAEKILGGNARDLWARFFLAGANGAKGTYESRFGRWITAFRHGWQGVAIFKELHAEYPSFKDVLYGIGTYDYWRSAMTNALWWMPGVEDKRDEAIAMLWDACKSAMYVGDVARVDLIAILINEKRFGEALNMADELLERYKGNLVITWGKARALLGLKRFDDAEKCLIHIRSRIVESNFDNNYNITLVHYYLAEAYAGMQRNAESLGMLQAMAKFRLSTDNRKRLEEFFTNAAKLKKEVGKR